MSRKRDWQDLRQKKKKTDWFDLLFKLLLGLFIILILAGIVASQAGCTDGGSEDSQTWDEWQADVGKRQREGEEGRAQTVDDVYATVTAEPIH